MDVTVVGAGISGLTTAVRLLEAGHRVRVVAAGPTSASTSSLAAAVWFPTHVGPPDRVLDWGARTYTELALQARSGVPGVVMRESLALYRRPPGQPDWAAAVGGVRPAPAAELPPGYDYGLRFVVPLVEMPLYLPWLVARVAALGGTMIDRRIAALDDVAGETAAVINCTGLAARELAADPSVHPVRGQIVRVSNPGLTVSVRDESHPDGRAYVHPRTTDCILGGTLDENEWDTRVDPEAAAAIVRRCRDIVPALATATVLEHIVGLRPARPTVRLEESAPARGGARILHNYGHGGSGITLSWGCATDLVALVGS
ncbi:FAD-dependent oxidoreductase [Pseudonocardia sp. GCM10023141]|uniref:FAD-dependent oxidoreductase n=1 Tax=Pseudonocardia sp. GCM10023141 TaxID=3252653 RepID=UPI003611D307